jgi:hypothetical protein
MMIAAVATTTAAAPAAVVATAAAARLAAVLAAATAVPAVVAAIDQVMIARVTTATMIAAALEIRALGILAQVNLAQAVAGISRAATAAAIPTIASKFQLQQRSISRSARIHQSRDTRLLSATGAWSGL